MPNGATVADIVLPQIADSYKSGTMKALNAAPATETATR